MRPVRLGRRVGSQVSQQVGSSQGNRSTGQGTPGRPPTSAVLWAAVRVLATAGVLLALYFVLPMRGHLTSTDLTVLVVGLCAFVGLVVLQVASILRAEFPGIRAVESLATLVPLFLLLFATYYYVLDRNVPGSFSTPLTKIDSLYFTVTVFATVGFGDIVATTQVARAAVLIQMVGDLLVLGVLLKVVLGAREKGLARKSQGSGQEGQAADGPAEGAGNPSKP